MEEVAGISRDFPWPKPSTRVRKAALSARGGEISWLAQLCDRLTAAQRPDAAYPLGEAGTPGLVPNCA
ncbi:hypothetical protein BDA96_10G067900 [Sorghum bicolor]|jgi:hypothetical protein|uniref:Uncharacterized protein n=2 Tax=Sorghum bicolor TaxID=4558 RepID=A0A921TZZ1_SORBI|nr:hypothetical protein SORBI_3010G057200 [Sorghum bicolor]KAG0513054.1 hypothetical protein BDA96_10G067900 [Sorghum bicolor]